MSHTSSSDIQRKTYLSPQYIRSVSTVQSPKFNKEKAEQDHLKRKIIYQEKLARYDSYNSILSSKVQKELSSFKSKPSNQTDPYKNYSKCQPVSSKQAHNRYQQYTQSRLITCQQQKNNKNNKNLNQIRQKNHNLHQKNAQLKSYLKQINSGVSELQCILQQVQSTYNSLKKVTPKQFDGLWLMDENEQDEQETIKSQENINSQKHTKDTMDFENDRTGTFRSIAYLNDQSLRRKNRVKCVSGSRVEMIDMLEGRFKEILQKITKREMFEMRIDNEIGELNALEREIDQLRRNKTRKVFEGSNNGNKLIRNSRSQNNLLISGNNCETKDKTNHALSKVKSLQRISS